METAETEKTLAPPLLTMSEAAKLARVSRSHIWKRIERGEIPAVRVGNTTGPIRIPTEAFLAWLYGGAPEEGTHPVERVEVEAWLLNGSQVDDAA